MTEEESQEENSKTGRSQSRDFARYGTRFITVTDREPPGALPIEPFDTLPDRVIQLLSSREGLHELPPHKILSEVFQSEQLDGANVQLLLEILPARAAALAAAKDTAAPSSISRDASTFQAEQERRPIFNGRPAQRCGPSVTLYHPAFAAFVEAMDALDAIAPSEEELRLSGRLLSASSQILSSESARIQSTKGPIQELLAVPLFKRPLTDDQREADAYASQPLTTPGEEALVAYIEWTPELGQSGDPGLKISALYRDHVFQDAYTSIRNASSCPCVLLALAGPYMCVLGAVLTPRPVVEHLTEYIYIGAGPRTHARTTLVARMFHALRTAVAALQAEYAALARREAPDNSALFPRPSFRDALTADERAVVTGLAYESWFAYEGKADDDVRRAMFLARLRGAAVVVKFCEAYSADAHRLLAAHGLAPALHLCAALRGGLHMVVMARVAGETAFRRFRTVDAALRPTEAPLASAVRADVRRALALLHAAGLVFGDLRRPNVMVVSTDGRDGAMLVDFDWAGREGQARYPPMINDGGEIKWAAGVCVSAVDLST
ncbi:hypothetical protein BV25DRAFT_1843129 [Artomyces pyxidatus]|uniref:Uncharacterized protein n=1 Tax=Artomyces pyxidatus TaxID=48021 RepID=A0ACB8SH38_9AGAM|nr:hypothetical protein BV25DRAFT_1843129 [Artomyces pyxidatus]